ncbi:MAG: hypothetical protein KKI08_11695 [Armatimonadetes bacterium]|nr:hypothetical protein [Armatimonadota bacterium]
MAANVRLLWTDEAGAAGVEYSILVSLVVVVVLVSWQQLGCATAWSVFRSVSRTPLGAAGP